MASVLAIVSKAVFEKMGDDLEVGAVVDTDRYASTPTAFDRLRPGDAIFLVTVRPPKEALWLVAILEKPKKKGKAWVGVANTTPIRDVTPLISQLVFESGKGITAKKGALAMSLQTPRVLTDADVALLRGSSPSAQAAASPAVAEYTRQVALTPAAKKAKADAEAAAANGQRFALRGRGRPFQMLAKLPKPQLAQLTLLTKNNDAGTPKQCVNDEEWAGTELYDVVELATDKVTHQLYMVPYYGGGHLYAHDSTDTVATIIQHGFAMDPEEDDLEFRKALAAAYVTASPAPTVTVDFRLDWVPPKATPKEKDERAKHKAAIERLEKVLGESKERYRLFEELTAAQQTAIREELPRLDPYEHFGHFERLGVPPPPALARWAGVATPTLLERRVPDGEWPLWKWVKSAQVGDVEPFELVNHFRDHLDEELVLDTAWFIGTQNDNPYQFWAHQLDSDRAVNDAQLAMIRLLAKLIDSSGDDAAVAFAQRAYKELITDDEAHFWLAGIATFALVARARRREEGFPKKFWPLAKDAGFLGYGASLREGKRDIYEVIPPKDREAFLELDGIHCVTVHDEEIRKGRTYEVPVLLHTWLIADLVPTKAVAKAMIEDVARWNYDTQPAKEALAMIKKVGPICVPFIKKALKTTKSKHKRVLEQALALFDKD